MLADRQHQTNTPPFFTAAVPATPNKHPFINKPETNTLRYEDGGVGGGVSGEGGRGDGIDGVGGSGGSGVRWRMGESGVDDWVDRSEGKKFGFAGKSLLKKFFGGGGGRLAGVAGGGGVGESVSEVSGLVEVSEASDSRTLPSFHFLRPHNMVKGSSQPRETQSQPIHNSSFEAPTGMGYLKKRGFGTLYTRGWSRSRLVVPLWIIVDSTLISCLSWRALPPSIESSNSLSEILPPPISCHASSFSESVPSVSQSRFAIKILARPLRADGDSRTGKSGTRHLLNKTKNKAIPCPREKLVMIAMNAALEDVYKKEEFQPLLPLGRVSLLSELAGREDQLINMNLKSGWLIAATLSWRLSGREGACYRNLFPGVNLVSSILREKKDGNEWEDWSSLFISRKELTDFFLGSEFFFVSLCARGEARPTTNEGGKLALLAVALFLGLLRQKLRRGGGPRPRKERVAKWSKAADCKSVEVFLRRFESCLSQLFVVDFREEKRGIRQRKKANRTKLLWPFHEVQLYRIKGKGRSPLISFISARGEARPTTNEGGKLALLAVALFLGLVRSGKGRKERWSLLLGTWLVHSLAHELAASPEATKGGGLGPGRGEWPNFKEEKRGIRQRRKANRANLLWPFREVELYRIFARSYEGRARPGKGIVVEWSSVEVFLRRFESCLSYLFVVDFREEKRGIHQRRKVKTERSSFGRSVKFNCIVSFAPSKTALVPFLYPFRLLLCFVPIESKAKLKWFVCLLYLLDERERTSFRFRVYGLDSVSLTPSFLCCRDGYRRTLPKATLSSFRLFSRLK
nr:hypothetical protein [Tanacetum cinerariifolium]